MKTVLMSVHPRWCKEIFVTKRKTIEVRKTVPKLETPFTVYVYQTKSKGGKSIVSDVLNNVYGGGKVIGSFLCCGFMRPNNSLRRMAEKSLLTENELIEYSNAKTLYGWTIIDPKLFDKPREITEFMLGGGWNAGRFPLTRPPQSWCYVEAYRDDSGDHDTHHGI